MASSVFSSRDAAKAPKQETNASGQKKTQRTGADGVGLFAGINRRIDRFGEPHAVNESLLVAMLDQILATGRQESLVYWLAMARLMEAALLCAGCYADSCEFHAAGDLLINPRKIQVHVKGRSESFTKERHVRLSDQLKRFSTGPGGPVQRRDAVCDIVQPALVPYLFGKLAASGCFGQNYLQRLQQCMNDIADTIRFLLAWQIDSAESLHKRFADSDACEQQFVREHMCDIDDTWFRVLGCRIDMMMTDGMQPEPGYRLHDRCDERNWIASVAQNN